VLRDTDAGEHGVRAKVAAAAEQGGFVLLVGGSSVGKTRCAAEAVRALLPYWWLVHPSGPGEVAALTAASPTRTVVWLDELQRYLDGEHGLAGEAVRALLGVPGPVVLIGTLWPDRYHAYTAVPAPGGSDLCAREREVLGLAAVIRIGEEFSLAEQGRARAAATRDRRLALALDAAGYGLTQTLAAAPQLVSRWEDARAADPYGWAVLTAALDVTRLGGRAPLTVGLLRAAAPGYCTSAQQAEAPGNWFERALAYATEKLHGAAAPLTPVAAGMGRVAGYTVADYLLQYASRERHRARVPASTWDAAASHIRDPADAARLAAKARDRLLYSYAIPLYRHADDGFSARQLAKLLVRRGDPDEAEQILRARAEAGDGYAAKQLADLLRQRGKLDRAEQILHALANDEYNKYDAAHTLADLLKQRGDLDGVRVRAEAGDTFAAERLAELLVSHGDLDGGVQILSVLADTGEYDGFAAEWLADLLKERGDLDGLRARADAGDEHAARQLAELLAEDGYLDEAAQILRARADADDRQAAGRLAWLLLRRGDLDGAGQILRALGGSGYTYGEQDAVKRLAELLIERGDLERAVEILRVSAEAGYKPAAWKLADLFKERGDLQELRALADARDEYAAKTLAELLVERGDLEGLHARADAHDHVAARTLARLLIDRGDLEGLRARADADDEHAARTLAELLVERGDLEGLRAWAEAGDRHAAYRLADLQAEPGQDG
jgi:predicted negative regulator of RcsB-dependent stress response